MHTCKRKIHCTLKLGLIYSCKPYCRLLPKAWVMTSVQPTVSWFWYEYSHHVTTGKWQQDWIRWRGVCYYASHRASTTQTQRLTYRAGTRPAGQRGRSCEEKYTTMEKNHSLWIYYIKLDVECLMECICLFWLFLKMKSNNKLEKWWCCYEQYKSDAISQQNRKNFTRWFILGNSY